jgi:hypothetical protein
MNSAHICTRPRLQATVLLGLALGLVSVAACSDRTPTSAPVVPTEPSLGVNNGGNNRRILFEKDGAIYGMNPDGSGVANSHFRTLHSS